MINLVPPSYSQAMRTGRANARLRVWLLGAIIATGGLVVIIGFSWLYMNHQASSLTHTTAAINQQLQSQNLGTIQKQAATINSNVKVIDQVLGREIRFSDLIQQIGSVLPPGVILNTLSVSKIDGAIDLNVAARDVASANQVAVNLSDPKNKLFSKTDIVSINCTGDAKTYPCTGNFRALFSAEAKKSFLNAATGAAQ
jgi:Tfp pilus assembly protein PilN